MSHAPAIPIPPKSRASRFVPFVPILLALLVAITASFVARPSAPHGPSPTTGSPAPDFSLPIASGHSTALTLSSLTAKSPVLIVYFPGTSCSRCLEHLQHLAEYKPQFDEAHVQLLAISSEAMTTAPILPFAFLSDAELTFATSYGLQAASSAAPLHGIFLVDQSNTIRFDMKSNHPYDHPESIVRAARALQN